MGPGGLTGMVLWGAGKGGGGGGEVDQYITSGVGGSPKPLALT